MMTTQPQAHAVDAPPLGQHYEVGGKRLWLHRSGTGGPAVVFLPGASAVGLDYLNLHDEVATLTTSVLYDRGGTGWSSPAELPRTAGEVATELRDLLDAAGVPGPYLLVAHSLGGAYARRFGQLFPGEVAGVVYLDAFHEDSDAYLPERLHLARLRQPDPGPFQLALMRPFMRRLYRQMLAGWPAPLRSQLLEGHLSPEWWRAGVRERSNMASLAEELRGGGGQPDVPLITLVPLGIDPGMRLLMSGRALREMNEGKLRLGEALAGSVSRGECRVLKDARHSQITTDRPDAVMAAVRDVLGQVAGLQLGAVDWARIPGPRWYRPELAAAAADALARADTSGRAVQAAADLRHEVSNDHAGTLYPAAVPAVGVLMQVILERPGKPRAYVLDTLLDWWGCFVPEPGFEVYEDPARGPVEITEGIMHLVREAAPALKPLAVGEDRRAINEVLFLLDRGWVVDDDWSTGHPVTRPGRNDVNL
jgi:pimeloyl-ACP methyl ester carboxylesterase